MNISRRQSNAGNTLILVTVFSGILATVLFSFLKMVNNSNLLTSRTMTWNHSLPVAEAGVEEATAALGLLSYGQNASAILQSAGWTSSGTALTRTRTLTNGYFTVLVTSSNTAVAIGPTNPPVICSTGFVQIPVRSGNYIGRTVRVTTKYNNPQTYALLAKDGITVSGNGSRFDSFDSSDSTLSTAGMYDPAKFDDQAHVGCYATAAGCISVGSASVYGDVNTAFGGSATVQGSGAVGDKAYVSSGVNNGTIQPGHSLNNLNALFMDVQVPFTSGSTLAPATVNGVSYQYVADSANYYFPGDMTLSSPLLIRGKATIYLTGSFNINAGASIVIAPGASLNLVVGGPTCGINGGGIVNQTGVAANCSVQCLPTCTSGTFGGGAVFIGTINAPQADFSLNGGTSMCGGFTAKSFKLTGGMNIHYDKALSRTVNGSLYSITSWAEL